MPRKSVRQRRRSQGCLSALISITAVVALLLVAAIFVTEKMDLSRYKKMDKQEVTVENTVVPVGNSNEADKQMVLNANTFSKNEGVEVVVNTPIPTATPAPTATPTPTPEPTFNPDDPYALVRPQPQGEGYLPIFKKANTDKKQIAITLNECSGPYITKKFCQLATEYKAKLTLFPFGENVMVSDMDEVLRKCVFELGFEVENACYNHTARLFRLNDEEMAMEIWKQNMALNYVLGVDYQPHFLSVYGGNGNNDPRTHAYLEQEGYLGIAGWTYYATGMNKDGILQSLKPGAIYYFRTSESDMEKMEYLMQLAKHAGYKIVTLNELFGYEPNAYTRVDGASVLSETMPVLENYDGAYYTLKEGYSTWAVYKLQARLAQLGYLTAESVDGVYGEGTLNAVRMFQVKHEIAATGMADVETQKIIFSNKAQRA